MIKQENVFRGRDYGTTRYSKMERAEMRGGMTMGGDDLGYGGRTQYDPGNKPNPKLEHVSLFICGHCGKDTKNDHDNTTEKVIEYGFANMLCGNCRNKMRNEMVLIAMKYLEK